MPTPRPPPPENYVDSSRSMLSEFRRKHKDDRKLNFRVAHPQRINASYVCGSHRSMCLNFYSLPQCE